MQDALLRLGSDVYHLTGWDGDGLPTAVASTELRGEAARSFTATADGILWRVRKSASSATGKREATGHVAGSQRDFYVTRDLAQCALDAARRGAEVAS